MTSCWRVVNVVDGGAEAGDRGRQRFAVGPIGTQLLDGDHQLATATPLVDQPFGNAEQPLGHFGVTTVLWCHAAADTRAGLGSDPRGAAQQAGQLLEQRRRRNE